MSDISLQLWAKINLPSPKLFLSDNSVTMARKEDNPGVASGSSQLPERKLTGYSFLNGRDRDPGLRVGKDSLESGNFSPKKFRLCVPHINEC